jgi:protein-tyrosine phosphatase
MLFRPSFGVDRSHCRISGFADNRCVLRGFGGSCYWLGRSPPSEMQASEGLATPVNRRPTTKEAGLVSILFVCLGNICRSPAAEAVFRALADRRGVARLVTADSAGTHGYQVGRAPDARAQWEARRRGFDLSGLIARRAETEDFRRFDYVLAMDRHNLADLAAICPAAERRRLYRFLDFAPDPPCRDVADPYLGDSGDFVRMFDLIELGSNALLDHLVRRLQ